MEEMEAITAGDYSFTPDGYWQNVSSVARDFIRKCFTLDPTSRITAHEALEHKWFIDSAACRHDDCPQSIEGSFSSKKDRDRHEAKHKPGVLCQSEGCEKIFSSVDNMKDHVRRIHRKSKG